MYFLFNFLFYLSCQLVLNAKHRTEYMFKLILNSMLSMLFAKLRTECFQVDFEFSYSYSN